MILVVLLLIQVRSSLMRKTMMVKLKGEELREQI
jgi:hypothetical protein